MDTETAVERLRFQPFRLGACLVDPQLNRITCDAASVRVEPKVMEVLILLCARPGEVISKEELFQTVWPETFVTDHVLSHAVWQLRKALGDVALIEVVPKRGYRVTSEVHRCSQPDQVSADVDKEQKEESDSGNLTVFPVNERRLRRWWPWVVGAASVLLGTGALFWHFQKQVPSVEPKPLAPIAGDVRMPSLSPDGRRAAFAWNGGKGDIHSLYIKQIGSTGPPVRLTSGSANDGYPAWSPDDRWIAFMRAPQSPGDNTEIRLIPSLGGPERRLAEMVTPVGPLNTGLSWTPDGKWLAFAAVDSPHGPYSIWAISIETGERRQLTRFPTQLEGATYNLGDNSPSFSPDGLTLAFSRHARNRFFEVYVQRFTQDLRTNGEARKIIDLRPGFVSGIAWTADGRDLVYGAGDNYANVLWRVPVSGTQLPQLLPNTQPDSANPSIAGSHLVYNWSVYSEILFRLDTRTGQIQRLFNTTSIGVNLTFSPDGRKIAFASTSNRTGNKEIWTCDADGTNCTQLTSFNGPLASSPNWSPDGRWIVLIHRGGEGQAAVYVVPADGGTPRRISNTPADHIYPSWSHDGGWIYFSSNRTGRFELWKMPKDGGDEVQVTHSGGYFAFESPDGRYIYYSKSRRSALFRMPSAGGVEEQILPRIEGGTSFGITAKGVYFFPDITKIQILDTASGRVSTLATPEDAGYRPGYNLTPGYGLTVTQDGAYVAWFQVPFATGQLMLVEGFR